MRGFDGNDFALGGNGIDTLIGGGGREVFILAAGDGQDTIWIFTTGSDLIALDCYSFGFAADATAAYVVKIGGAAPEEGPGIYISSGMIILDDDWSDAAGREVLAQVMPDSPVIGDIALI